MNNFFRRLPLPVKLLLLILLPLALIAYLASAIYNEKSEKVDLYNSYLGEITQSADISELIRDLQAERRFSYIYSIKKDVDSRAQIDIQRPLTDMSLKKLDQYSDELKNFRSYVFLQNIDSFRHQVDRGTSPDAVMHFYTNTIFRLNTFNFVTGGKNKNLDPIFKDLSISKIINEMVSFLGIIRANFYNDLLNKENNQGMLLGTLGTYDVYNSYSRELLEKASSEVLKKYKEIMNSADVKYTTGYIDTVFKKFSFDTLYNAEEWWTRSAIATDKLRSLHKELMRSVKSRMDNIYEDAKSSRNRTIILLVIALGLVFAVMMYTTHVITELLKDLREAAQRIALGADVQTFKNFPHDVIGSLRNSIVRINDSNRQLTEAADAIGKGNFDVKLEPRSQEDHLVNALLRMKTSLQRFTREIELNREQFRQVADNAPVMIWMTDANKQCNFVNKSWLKFTGRRKEQEMGYGWIEGLHTDDYAHCSEVFEDAFADRKKYSLEYRFKRYDGEYRWLSESGAPLYSASGKFDGYIGSCTDIHEMKLHDERKDDFIKMASHELKTPVTSIKGYVQLLLTMLGSGTKFGSAAPPELKAFLSVMDKQIVKLTRLMSELLDLSRIDSGKLELNMHEFDLTELVNETIDEVKHTARQQITLECNAHSRVRADRDRLSQVLVNLLTNAIKYSPADSIVEVKIFNPAARTVAVSVTDQGIGIDAQHHEKIFERFYRVEGKDEQTYPGFGIGLFIASEIMRRHGGSLFVKSSKGKGSSFTFTLPAVE